MKRTVLKFTGKTLLTAISFVVMSTTVFAHAPARVQLTHNSINNKEFEVSLLQVNDEKILLNVKLQNPEGSNFILFVTDENNNELFSKEYNQKDLDVSITLVRSETVNSYTIGVRSENKQLQQRYSIVPTVKYIPDIVISKQ